MFMLMLFLEGGREGERDGGKESRRDRGKVEGRADEMEGGQIGKVARREDEEQVGERQTEGERWGVG